MDINEIFDTTRPKNLPTKSAIYVWGYNQSGQTGRKGKECQLRIPKQLRPELFGCPAGVNSRWLDVACGREHTAAVASDGSLFTWGQSVYALWVPCIYIFTMIFKICLFYHLISLKLFLETNLRAV